MHPLTANQPKALLPFDGKPLILRSIQMLQSWGVKEILINAHAHGEQIMAFCRDHSSAACRLTCSFEPEVLGTGGALKRAAWFFDAQNPLWLLNADIITEVDPKPLRAAMTRQGCIAALWMVPDAGPLTVDCAQGNVTNFRSKTPGDEGTATFSGLHLLRPEILNFLPTTESFSSIVPAYEKAMKAGRSVAAVSVEKSFWADVGTPEQYLDALTAWRRYRKDESSIQYIDPSARIERGAKVADSIVLNDAVIGRHASVHRAIVAPGTLVGQAGTRLLAPVSQVVDGAERKALNALGLGHDGCCAECLSPRGSARQFIRVSEGRNSVFLIRFDPARKENTLYGSQARRLHRAGLPVFEVLAEHADPSFLVVEDLGRVTLLDKVESATASLRMAWYQRAVALGHEFNSRTARMKGRNKLPLMPSFTMKLYESEHDLFLREFLRPRVKERGVEDRLLTDLHRAVRRLTRLPRVIVHRDYQSTNLMVHRRKLWLIDFQGMRKGPAFHDLASLLLDPYMKLSLSEVERLLAYYLRLDPAGGLREEDFYLAGTQRLIQALGAYGRLSRIPGCESFLDHIPAALERLDWCAQSSGLTPHIADWVQTARTSCALR